MAGKGIVYSSTHGKMCPMCNHPIGNCQCQEEIAGDGIVRLEKQTKGRRGKCATVVTGVPLKGENLKKLAKKLKKKCGTGGTTKNGVIEIQGDKRAILEVELVKQGWTVKRIGAS